jgi:hypothetical protein
VKDECPAIKRRKRGFQCLSAGCAKVHEFCTKEGPKVILPVLPEIAAEGSKTNVILAGNYPAVCQCFERIYGRKTFPGDGQLLP